MAIITAQDIIDVIVENDLQKYPIYYSDESELVLDANEYAIVIHINGRYNHSETALYQYPNNWRMLYDKQLNDALRYYYLGDDYEPDDIDLPYYYTDNWTMEEVREKLEANIVQIHPIIPYSDIEVVPFRIYDLINDIFEEQDEMYNY